MLRRDIHGLYGWGEFDRVGFALTGDGEEEFTLSRLRPGVTALTGMKTLLGSVALGVGVTKGGRWAGHLLLGRLPY